jgi:hypothetical protein
VPWERREARVWAYLKKAPASPAGLVRGVADRKATPPLLANEASSESVCLVPRRELTQRHFVPKPLGIRGAQLALGPSVPPRRPRFFYPDSRDRAGGGARRFDNLSAEELEQSKRFVSFGKGPFEGRLQCIRILSCGLRSYRQALEQNEA